jgi:sugar lactone lactonase YvrE
VAVQLGAQQILAVDLDGNAEVMTTVPTTIPFSIDWLPDGRLLVVAGPEGRLLRQEPDGSLVDHTDLSGLGANLNEIVVDGRGRIFVNGGTDFHPGEGEAPGFVALITPDGVIRRVAEGIAFPNGMAVTPDDSTLIVSESFGGTLTSFDIGPDGSLSNRRAWAALPGDGIVLDTEGAVWTPGRTETGPACLRVAEGGEVLDTVPLDRAGFACTLGGEDGRNPVRARGGLANAGRLRGQHQAPDDRAGDRPGPHRPRPGRPCRSPLNDRHGRARLTGGDVNKGRQSADPRSPGGLVGQDQAGHSPTRSAGRRPAARFGAPASSVLPLPRLRDRSVRA